MYNLQISEISGGKELTLEPYNAFYGFSNNTYLDKAKDWTKKVQKDKPIEIKAGNATESQSFTFKFKEETDLLNKRYKEKYGVAYGAITVQAEAEYYKENSVIEVPLSLPIPANYRNDLGTTPIIFVNRIVEEDVATGLARPYSGSPRLFNYSARLGPGANAVRIGTTASTPVYNSYSYYPALTPFRRLAGLILANDYILFNRPEELFITTSAISKGNLYTDNWLNCIMNLTSADARLVILYVYLNEYEAATFDFSEPVLIDGVLFIVNTIEGYKPGVSGVVKVELIKVIETFRKVNKFNFNTTPTADSGAAPGGV
jgi:hypothetical protein